MNTKLILNHSYDDRQLILSSEQCFAHLYTSQILQFVYFNHVCVSFRYRGLYFLGTYRVSPLL